MTAQGMKIPAGTGVGAAKAAGGALRVVSWRDGLVDQVGIDPRSAYVEQFWLPVLGPSATWLLRRLAGGLESSPEGFDLDLGETAHALGLGGSHGRHSALRRTIGRCVRFDVARYRTETSLAVRRLVAPLPRHHLLRLSSTLQEQHRSWEPGRRQVPAFDAATRRARLLALDLTELGESSERIERHLARWGAHPTLAYEAASWARSRHRAGDQSDP